MSTANGAPASTFARTRSVPTFSTVTVSGIGSVGLRSSSKSVSAVRPENTPSGSEVEVSRLALKKSFSSFESPENTPTGSDVNPLPLRLIALSSDSPENSPAGSSVMPMPASRSVCSFVSSENWFSGSEPSELFLPMLSDVSAVSPENASAGSEVTRCCPARAPADW